MLAELLNDGIGNRVLEGCSLTHWATYQHQLRTAAIMCGLSRAAGVSETMRQSAAVGALFHDLGKYSQGLLSLLDLPAVLDPGQQKLMGRHASIGSLLLREMQSESVIAGNMHAACRYGFAASMARDHHSYDLPPLVVYSGSQWLRTVTKILQVVDVADAVTSSREERPYLEARTAQEGESDPCAIVGIMLDRDYGESQTLPLPMLGLSPRQVAEMALAAKLAG